MRKTSGKCSIERLNVSMSRPPGGRKTCAACPPHPTKPETVSGACLCSLGGRHGPLVITFLVRTGNDRTGLQIFFHEEFVAATWAFLVDGLVGRGELALGVVRAAVESVALARLLLHQVPILAQRALHADEVLFHKLAIGIARAGREFTIASVANHQIAAAFRAGFIQRNVGHALALVETAGGLAIRIAGAGHELA